MELAEFLPVTILQARHFNDLAHMGLMDQSGPVVPQVKAFHSLLVLFPRTRQTFYCVLGRTILEGLTKVDKFLSIGEVRTLMN